MLSMSVILSYEKIVSFNLSDQSKKKNKKELLYVKITYTHLMARSYLHYTFKIKFQISNFLNATFEQTSSPVGNAFSIILLLYFIIIV